MYASQPSDYQPGATIVPNTSNSEGSWRPLLFDYLRDPSETWEADTRQAAKLRRAKTQAKAALAKGETDDVFFERFAFLVFLRQQKKKVPLHVLSIGGCGSHWLSSMLEDTGHWLDAGEVALPSSYEKALSGLSPENADVFLDAVDLLHTYVRTRRISPIEALERSILNSAHGVSNFLRIRRFRKNCKSVHLIRDPRDRTLSVTYRKSEFRSFHRPGMDDWSYLIALSRRTETDYERHAGLSEKADVETRYEDLRRDCVGELDRILRGLGFATDRERLGQIAFAYKAENLASGASDANPMNLNVTSIGSNWYSHPSDADRAVMHAIMAPAIWSGRYPLCDCSGVTRVETEGFPTTTVVCPDLAGVHIDLVRPGENYWRPAGGSTQESAARIRISVNGEQDWNAIPSILLEKTTDLCVAPARSCSLAEVPFEQMKNLQFLDISGHTVTAEDLRRLPGIVRQVFATKTVFESDACNALAKSVIVVQHNVT
jgi:hypothetical protein